MPAATVLVPTHSHGPLLTHAVGSALRQTVEDIEVFIVGDGPTPETEDAARELERLDERVRTFTFPKGENHGEVHRDTAIQESSAPVVAYLSDDDLWFPNHLEYLLGLLDGGADFAHSTGVRISPDGSMHVYPGDLADPFWLDFLRTKGNFIPLHAAAHSIDLYRESSGWAPPPEGIWSDVSMWRRLLDVPGCRAVSGGLPTSLHLTTNRRGDETMESRLAEIELWSARLRQPGGSDEITREIAAAAVEQLATAEAGRRSHAVEVASLRKMAAGSSDDQGEETRRLQDELERARRQRDGFEAQVRSLRGSQTWRLRNALLSLPVLGGLLRRVGTARSRRGAR